MHLIVLVYVAFQLKLILNTWNNSIVNYNHTIV